MKYNHLLLLPLLIPVVVFAESAEDPRGWLEPQPLQNKKLEMSYGDEIYIKGENLQGRYDMEHGHPPKKEVCLVSIYSDATRNCYAHDSSQITMWTNNIITLKIPEDVYPESKVHLRYQEYKEDCAIIKGKQSTLCGDSWDWAPDIVVGDFIVKSIIESVIEKGGKVAQGISPGKSYLIEGKWFGQSQGRIYIGGTELSRNDLVMWAPNKIEIKVSKYSGTEISIDNGTGRSSFLLSDQKNAVEDTQPTNVVTVNGDTSAFADIATSHSYYPAIEWGKSSGVLKGYPDGTFRADSPVNRAEFLKIIIEANSQANVNDATISAAFPDVDPNAWYAPYVKYAKQFGIVEGYPDGTFRPEKSVNFAEALKIAYEALSVQTESVGGEWYAKYLAHAKYNNALFTNEVDVGSDMTRKDVVWLVWKLSNL